MTDGHIDVIGKSGDALAARAAAMEKAAPLKKFKEGAEIRGHGGARYVMRNVKKGGGQVGMTLERTDKRRRPEGMSPRQFRNMVKAERRLERDRMARKQAAAAVVDETLEREG